MRTDPVADALRTAGLTSGVTDYIEGWYATRRLRQPRLPKSAEYESKLDMESRCPGMMNTPTSR
jgi:hypothetical protein